MVDDPSLLHKRLLVVDDNPVNVELLLDLLDEQGYERVTGLSDPRQVVDHCRQQMPNLVLLDIRMPHMDGYAVLDAMRDAFADETPPVIVLTAQVDEATRQRALAMGVRDFLTKPFDHAEVMARIRNALHDGARYQRRREQASKLERLVAKRTAALERLSCTDPVTQLPNRRGLTAQLRKWQLADYEVGALFIALQGLDAIMRYQGHRITEVFLTSLAQRLADTLPAASQLGVWGSHELLLIEPHAPPEALVQMAERIHQTLVEPLQTAGVHLAVNVRIGIAHGRRLEPERLVHMAALAVPHQQHFQPRQASPIQRYSAALEASEQRLMQLRQALPGACERGETQLHFQPKIALASGEVNGAEVLLRWEHPALGMVSPAEFIPMAEETGDIIAIGSWVLERSLAALSQWQRSGNVAPDFSLAVNVSAHQLCKRGFVAEVEHALQRHAVRPSTLEVEVTESGLMSDLDTALEQLQQLAALGVTIAIDDFGTGHSSLAYLRRMPVDTIKIDRSFLIHMLEDTSSRRLVESITAMAHGLGCRVVAEGIETAEQARCLHEMGCEIGQGYWFGRPSATPAFLDSAAHRPA